MRTRINLLGESVKKLKMNYLRGFKSVLGSPSAENQPSAQETIERLCDRVDSSTLLEDRRDAVRALKSLSKKFRLEVGTQAMQLLIKVLQTDRSDTEIVGMAIETLCNIMSTEPQVQDEQTPTKSGSQQSDSDVGLQFTEIFIKNADNVTLLLGILEEYEFHVRWPTVKLLTMLLTNKPNLLQQCILVSPMGVSRLMDLLSDSREIIRNEGLLLLIQLTKSNAAIQKIVAFENAFDRLFEIIAEEGYSDGGIVVEDCLHLMINLLRNNVSNQNFFREGSFIQRFTPFFEMSALAMQGEDEDGWLEQKVSNVQQMLKVVRILVSPDNPQQATTGAQKMMNQSGLLKLLCDILMASGIPADILTEAINTVSEVIRGFPANQEYFSQVNAPSEPPRPAIVVLLMSMINDKQPFSLRCAVLYCFQCYLHKNEQGQSQIVSTLLPSSSDVAASVSAGQLLCAGIFSMDPLSNWCAAVALSHCIKGNPTQKEQLLRVQLATSLGNPPVSLLQQCTNILAQGGDVQTRVGLLLLLCSWLSNCPIAVAHFLHNTANIPHLMAQVVVDAHGEEGERLVGYLCALLLGLCLAYNDDSVEQFKKDDLKVLINKRIGQDNLLEKISYISKSEYFTAAVKSPQIKDDGTHQVLIDHEFTKLFKKFDAAVTKAVEETTEAQPTANHNNVENHDSIVASYKELIREQDEELCRVRSRYADMESSYNQATAQLQHQAQEIHQLKSQLAFAQSYQHSQRSDEHVSPQPGQDLELDSLRNQMNELYISKQDLEKRLQDKSEQCQKLEKDLEVANAQYAVAAAAAELAEPCDSLNSSLNKNQLEDMLGLRKTVSTLEHEVATLKEQNAALQEDLNRAKLQLPGSSIETTQRCKELEARLAEVTIEKDSQLQEHEDLLVMLADQEEKLAKYKKMLKDAGHEVSEDDDEDEDDNVDEEDDDEGVEEEEEEEAVEVKEEQEEIKEQPDLPQEEENIGEEVTPEQETEVNTNGFDEETNFDELQTQSIMEEIPVAVEEHGKSSQEESNENIATPHKETEQHAATTTDVGEELQEPIEEKGIEEDPDIHHVGEEEIEGYSQPATDAHAQFNDQSNPEQPYDPNEQQNYYDNNGQQFYTDDQLQMNYYSYGQGGDSADFLTGYDSSGNYNGYSMQQGDDTQIGGYYGDNAQGNYNNFYDNSQPANDGQFFTQQKTQTNVEGNVNMQQTNSNSYSQQQQLYYNWDQYPGNTSTDAHVKQDAGLFGGY